ncbi:MAG: GNAT family N-acetyltransferase [Burkholderiales bacterium]|nr:GNAT family N-acetyltransferase [Burkholderiales bacterium]
MRPSLERLGRYDEPHARERLAEGFSPARTRHIVVDGQRVGFFVLARLRHALRLDHLYIDPPYQGRGIGHAVLSEVCEQADRDLLPIELCALRGSDANRFYLRHGFVKTGEGAWDIDYLRMPQTAGLRAVHSLWTALQDRDWAAARALLHPEVQATWWTSGERFNGAEAFIEVNRRQPEGGAIHLVELARLADGRVLSVVRVDHPPRLCFASSVFLLDDGLITSIDEYWATAEPAPARRKDLAGRSLIDADEDPRALLP